MIQYVLRAPKFPILVSVPPRLIAMRSRQHAQRVRVRVPEIFRTDEPCKVIDATGEGFSLIPSFI